MMFADVACRLLQVAGKACTARGVITAEQIPDIVTRLRQAVSAEAPPPDGRRRRRRRGQCRQPAVARPAFIEFSNDRPRAGSFRALRSMRDFDK